MDPNATLAMIRDYAKSIITAEDAGHTVDSAASGLAQAVTDLDEWISKGGFLPEDWQKGRKQR